MNYDEWDSITQHCRFKHYHKVHSGQLSAKRINTVASRPPHHVGTEGIVAKIYGIDASVIEQMSGVLACDLAYNV